MKKILLGVVGIFFLLNTAHAGFLRKGYIANDQGKKCWYKQKTNKSNNYFHKSITSNTQIITFDDPKCMKDSGLGLGINKMMINNIISRPYSHSDAQFQTRENELFNSSLLQIKGYCIQSKTYSAIGVTVDYFIKGNSITGAIYGQSANGCSNK